jgi:uncharacterized protein (DUF1697 family)
MADLRALVAGLGYTDVQTLLNSGNVIFSACGASPSQTAADIEAALAKDLHLSVRVTVLSASSLARAIDQMPFADAEIDPSKLLVSFLADAAELARLDELKARDWAPERLAVGEVAAYLLCPNGVAESKLVKSVAALLGDAVTSRNWATVLKLGLLTSPQE